MNRFWVIPGLLVFILLCFPLVIVIALAGMADCFFWLATGQYLIDIDGALDVITKPAEICMRRAGLL